MTAAEVLDMFDDPTFSERDACPALTAEIARGLARGRRYTDPAGAELATVDEVLACLRIHRRVLDRPARRR
jgi:hypothetical protein